MAYEAVINGNFVLFVCFFLLVTHHKFFVYNNKNPTINVIIPVFDSCTESCVSLVYGGIRQQRNSNKLLGQLKYVK